MAGPGKAEGLHVPEEYLKKATENYYEMMNWSPETGNPTPAKLHELGLSWVLEL